MNRLLGVMMGGAILALLGVTIKVVGLVAKAPDFAERLMAYGALAALWAAAALLTRVVIEEVDR